MILDKEGPKSDPILEVARALCRTLSVSPAPEIVSWQDEYNTFVSRFSRSGGGRPVTPDFPVIDKNRILLKPLMQGMLEPEEWRPLLASSLIFYRQLRRQNHRGVRLRVSAILLALGILLVLAMAPNSPLPATLRTYFFGFVTVILIVATWGILIQYNIRRVLLADKKAVEVVGRERMLNVLQKLDLLRLRDIQEGKSLNWIGYNDLPRLPKRIENIQNFPIYETSKQKPGR